MTDAFLPLLAALLGLLAQHDDPALPSGAAIAAFAPTCNLTLDRHPDATGLTASVAAPARTGFAGTARLVIDGTGQTRLAIDDQRPVDIAAGEDAELGRFDLPANTSLTATLTVTGPDGRTACQSTL